MKTAVKRALQDMGLNVTKAASVPFGVDAFADIRAFCPNVRTAFDVGANFGQTVARMRTAFPAAQIYSFEPVPATFETLLRNTARYSELECVQAALGEAEGRIPITISEEVSGQNTLNISAKPDAPTVEVPVSTVDIMCAKYGLDRLDVLKIDTEGYETSVLKGAKRMLESGSIRFVLAECEFTHNPAEPHGDFFQIASLLMPLGYRVVAFYVGGADGNGWRWGDVLMMLPDGQRPVACSPYTR